MVLTSIRPFDWVDAVQKYNSENSNKMQVFALCANNYPFALSGRTDFKEAFDFNGQVRKISARRRAEFDLPFGGGVSLVEASDDWFNYQHLDESAAHIRAGRITQEVAQSAMKNQVYVCAIGTGAKFSYAFPKAEGNGVFDRNEKARDFWLNTIFKAWEDWAVAIGPGVYTGKRPGVFSTQRAFTDKVRLDKIGEYALELGGIDLGEVKLGEFDPAVEVQGSEALNLALTLYTNKRVASRGLVLLTEQMQYSGMEPCTVEELTRANQFMTANLGRYGDMLDHGHVGVRGSRTTNNPDDYDIRKFVGACKGPLVFAHHNILFENAKEPATAANLERDEKARIGEIKPKDMPYPERIYDVNAAMLQLRNNPEVNVAILSPEPKCSAETDLEKLAGDVAEAQLITAREILGAGFQESKVIPLVFASHGTRDAFDNYLVDAFNNEFWGK